MPLPKQRAGVSAVIAHHGAIEITSRLVEDLKSQADVTVEIIVSDDASPIPFPSTPGVTVVRSNQNGGYGAAINRGVDISTQPWILILNSDIRVKTDFLKCTLDRVADSPPAVFGFRHFAEGQAEPSAAPLPTFFGTLGQHCDAYQPIARRVGWDRAWKWSDPADLSTRTVGWVSGAAMLMRSHIFRDVGGFDERFFMYSEEVELQQRLRSRGIPAVLIGDIDVTHTGAASSSGLNRQVEQLRSRLLYEEITRGRLRRRALEWGLLGVLTVDACYQRLMGLSGNEYQRRRSVAERRRRLQMSLAPTKLQTVPKWLPTTNAQRNLGER